MNINTFRGQFVEGFQQNNRFLFQIDFPSPLRDRLINTSSNFDTTQTAIMTGLDWLARGLLCDTTRMPDRAFETTQMTQYGVTEQFPVKSDYTTIDCSFLLPLSAGRNVVSRVFDAWQNVIHNMTAGLTSSRDLTWPDNYYARAHLYVLDRQNYTTACYVFENLYPKSVESVQVNWGENSELARLPVTFAFTLWTMAEDVAPLVTDDLLPQAPFYPYTFVENAVEGQDVRQRVPLSPQGHRRSVPGFTNTSRA